MTPEHPATGGPTSPAAYAAAADPAVTACPHAHSGVARPGGSWSALPDLHALQGRDWERRTCPPLPSCPLKGHATVILGPLNLGASLRGQPVGPAALGEPASARLLGVLPSDNRGVPSASLGCALPHEVSPKQANSSPIKALPFSKACLAGEGQEWSGSLLSVALFGSGPSPHGEQGECFTGDE